MAILKNLIVNGSSKFLNTTYFQDVSIAGSATLSSLSLSGTLTVNGATTINNALNVTGTSTINRIIASSFIVNNGIELSHNTPYIDFHFGNSTTDHTSRIIENSSGTLHIENNLSIASTLSAPTGVISTLNSTNVNVTNNLRANHYDLQTVAQLGGSFYVSPTVKFPNSGTTLKVEKSGSTLTLTITDSSITSTTMAGVVWTTGSGVKVSGTINGVVTGTMDGTVSSINTSSHVLTLSVSGENSGNVQASPSGNPYNASQFKDLTVMLYTRKQDGTNKMINTASGAIASFTDGGNNVPVKQLVVDIEPVQDLHGYENPWPAGGGKNKLHVTAVTQTSNGVTFTVNEDGTVKVNGTASSSTIFRVGEVSNGGSYIINGSPSGADNTYGLRIGHGSGNTFVGRQHGADYPYTSSDKVIIEIYVFGGQTLNNIVFKPMIRLASVSDATFAPYSNICPISGHTSAVVTRTGKNFLAPIPYQGLLYNVSVGTSVTLTAGASVAVNGNTITYDVGAWGYRDFKTAPLKAGTYHVRIDTSSISGARVSVYVVSADNVIRTTNFYTTAEKLNVMCTVEDGDYMVVYVGANAAQTLVVKDMQVEVGSAYTNFEPYNGHTVTIDLGGTRYGGTLDVTTGVLTVDRGYRLLNGVNGDGVTYVQNGHTTNTTRAFVRITDKAYGTNNMISSSFFCQAAGDSVGMMFGRTANNGTEFFLNPSVPNTEEGVKAWFAENPTDFVYPLAEPFIVQLSKTEVRTLQGYNNIWSNTGDTNVIYESSQVDSTSNYNVGIWMNCYDQANSSSTIRVYNGSSRWPNVFLGNMTNADLPRVNGNAPYGYGLYSDNVFLRGIISATGGLIGNWTIGTTGMYYNSDAPGSTSITMIPGGTTASTTSIGGSSGSKSWIFTGKNLFGIDTTGKLYASSAEISGKITANSGSIAGWRIESTYLASGTATAPAANTLLLSPAGTSSSYTVAGTAKSGWMITAGTTFGVNKDGGVYATSGKIGGWTLDASSLYTGTKTETSSIIVSSADVTRTINGASRTGLRLVVGSNFGVSNTGVLYANSANISGTLTAGANSQIGPWTVTTTSIYKGSNTPGTANAAYFGNSGLSVGNKFRVDASGVATLGELSGYHATMDTDSFDVLNGNTMLATFGENVVLGSNSDVQLSINNSGIIMTDNYFKIQNYFGDADIFTVKVKVPDVRTYETKQSYFEYYSPDMVFNSELANIEIKGNFIQGVGQKVYLVLLDKSNDWNEYSRVQLSTSYYTSGYDTSKAYVRINNDGINFINNTMSQTVAQHPIIDWACIAFDVTLQDTPLTTMNIIGDLNLSGRYDENSETTIGGRIVCEEIANSDGTTLGAISHIGSIIMSTTLDTMDKVIAVYGGGYWIQHSGYFLRGATSGVTDDFNTSDGGADAVTLTAAQSGMPSHSHSTGDTAHPRWPVFTGTGSTETVGSISGEGYKMYQIASSGTWSNRSATNSASANASQSHTNLPKYKNVYIWERTA